MSTAVRGTGRTILLSLLAATLSLAIVGAGSAYALSLSSLLGSSNKPLDVKYSFPDAMTKSLLTGAGSPPGANPSSCKSSSAHPNPVILVHGTVENQKTNWSAISPLLTNDGACVYSFNYGSGSFTLGQFYGLNTVESSAGELKNFVNKVKSSTGRSKVNLVGHSQGGVVIRYYVQELGGTPNVDKVVSISAPHAGTTMSGIAGLAKVVPGLAKVFVFSWCKSCADQIQGSALIKKVTGKPVPTSIKWTNLATKYDEISTPYSTAFLNGPNITNILIQDGCSQDLSEHLAISYSQRAAWFVKKALNPSTTGNAPCTRSLPLIGG